MTTTDKDVLEAVHRVANERRRASSDEHKADWGQYFTQPPIAEFMASLLDQPKSGPIRVLDPGAGAGILGVAAAVALLKAGARHVEVVAVEAETAALDALQHTREVLRQHLGDAVHFSVVPGDFLRIGVPRLDGPSLSANFDIAIGNPPYFKMSPSEPIGSDAPNAYARFMEVAAALLKPDGQMVFIVPRSFTSGLYFRSFRRRFHEQMSLERAHVFDSRRAAFKDDDVLQENVVVSYRRTRTKGLGVAMSASDSPLTLDSIAVHQVERPLVEGRDAQSIVLLPATPEQAQVVRTVRAWPSSLRGMGLRISTGPVVPFRTDQLMFEPEPGAFPLLWMQHVKGARVSWPIPGLKKAQYIGIGCDARLLVANETYVLMRRFSSKDETRRLTAVVLPAGQLPGERIGLENHLNYIHRPGGRLDLDEAHGLAALLSSSMVEQYFRIANGNTQVNASDIESLPLPDATVVKRLGHHIRANTTASTFEIDEVLWRLLTPRVARKPESSREAGGFG